MFKLILKSASKFQKILKLWKWETLPGNHAFLFLFPLTLNSYNSNWWQNLGGSFVLINFISKLKEISA